MILVKYPITDKVKPKKNFGNNLILIPSILSFSRDFTLATTSAIIKKDIKSIAKLNQTMLIRKI